MFNDIAVSAFAAMKEEGIERVLVIDLDVHQARSGALPCTRVFKSPSVALMEICVACRAMARLPSLQKTIGSPPLTSMVSAVHAFSQPCMLVGAGAAV